MSVQRYRVGTHSCGFLCNARIFNLPAEDGKWVMYEDHAAEIERLETENAEMLDILALVRGLHRQYSQGFHPTIAWDLARALGKYAKEQQ